MFSRVLSFLDFLCSHFRGGDGQSLPAGPQVSSRRHGAAVPRAWGQDAQDGQEMRSLSRVPHRLWRTLACIHTYCRARPSPSRVKDRQSGSSLLSATRAFAILNHVYSRVSYSRHLLHVSVFRGWLTISWQQPLKPPWQKEWIIFQTGAFLQSSEQIHTWFFDKSHFGVWHHILTRHLIYFWDKLFYFYNVNFSHALHRLFWVPWSRSVKSRWKTGEWQTHKGEDKPTFTSTLSFPLQQFGTQYSPTHKRLSQQNLMMASWW